MNSDAIRHFYAYHFTINRQIWDDCIMQLSQEQFTQPINYSIGSIRNHVIHMINVDEAWFCGLRGEAEPQFLDVEQVDDRAVIRAHWDRVEQDMRDYLATLTDDRLDSKPFADGDEEEDIDLLLWQVLLHVVNHGTDHRSQLLRLLHDAGVKTPPQDYVRYIYAEMQATPKE